MPPLYLPEELRRYAGEIGPALACPILANWPEGSKYHSAEQAEAIARVLIDHVPTHQELVHAQIAFIFREKMATRDRCVWGKASKADGKLSFFAGFDFVIELNWQQWRKLTDHQKLALIDHELEHCGREQDEAGKWSWVLRSHEIEAFNGEVTRWGLWRDDLKVFAGAVGHAQQLGMFEGAHD